MNEYIVNKKHIMTGFVIKGIAIISAIYGLIVGISEAQDMTYFTNLSNILIMLILMVSLILDIVILATDNKNNPKKNIVFIIKYMLTLCISITMLIYMCILAPTSEDGFFMSYAHNNYGSLCLHFITPFLAVIDFILYDYNYKSSGIHSVYAIIPPLMYVGMIVVLAENGMRWGEYEMTAPYNFLNYGAPSGWFGFDIAGSAPGSLGIGVAYMIVGLVLIFVGIGRLFLFIKDKRQKATIANK